MLTDAVAQDGTPVAPYLLLPADDEAELIHRAIGAGKTILELGCGAGRVTRKLVALGHKVYAIDQSPDMIEHLLPHEEIDLACADIEDLDLDRRFDGVVLASYLVNVVDEIKRIRFLETCRRHAAGDGVVVIQRIDPQTRWTVGAESAFGPVCVRLVAVNVSDQILNAQIEYRVEDQTFMQAVVAQILDDRSLDLALTSAGLRLDHVIDAKGTWIVARPMTPSH